MALFVVLALGQMILLAVVVGLAIMLKGHIDHVKANHHTMMDELQAMMKATHRHS